MTDLATPLQALRATIPGAGAQGYAETAVPGVRFFWTDRSVLRCPVIYESGIVLIGQGAKTGWLGERSFRYDPSTYLTISLPTPLECETEAPVLGLFVTIDMGALHDLVALAGPRPPAAEVLPSVAPTPLDPAMRAATGRLAAVLSDPLEARALGPGLRREILFRALTGPQGGNLAALTETDAAAARIARALAVMHRDFARPLTVEMLASEAAMSARAFHRAFVEATSDTPLQYLKKLRLTRARGLLVREGMRASEAALAVGYESPSHFSREFRRHFEVPPSRARDLPYADMP